MFSITLKRLQGKNGLLKIWVSNLHDWGLHESNHFRWSKRSGDFMGISFWIDSNLFPVDARLTKAWDSRDELRDMRVCRRGEKAIGLDKDKRKSRGEGGLNKQTPEQNGCRPTSPPPQWASTGAWIQSFRPCSQTGQICLHKFFI